MSQQFTDLEHAVLEKMLAGENSDLKILREQFSGATVLTREMTGYGFFTNLEIPPAIPRLSMTDRVAITDISADLPHLKHAAGFVLFLDDGVLSCLEGFSNYETWPDSFAGFELSYLEESPRGSGCLIPSKQRDFEFALKDFIA